MSWRKAWQPIPVPVHGESPWTDDPGGLVHRVSESDTTESNLACKHITYLVLNFVHIIAIDFCKIVISQTI